MTYDTARFWDDIWTGFEDSPSKPDVILIEQTRDITPGRALEIGCGMGANALWLAEQGWQVTAIDFSERAIESAKRLADQRGVAVEFVVADASTYQPSEQFDLITSFYTHLPPTSRAKMLANASKALAPGGTLLFVSHDKSAPPSGWDDDALQSLTTPDEVVNELVGLTVQQAIVLEHELAGHAAHSDDEGEEHHEHSEHESEITRSTVVRAVK